MEAEEDNKGGLRKVSTSLTGEEPSVKVQEEGRGNASGRVHVIVTRDQSVCRGFRGVGDI